MSEFDKIDSKLDKIVEDINEINITLAAQHEQLKEHIKRSDLLEAKLDPIEKKITMIEGAGKLVGWIAVLCAAITGIAKVLKII